MHVRGSKLRMENKPGRKNLPSQTLITKMNKYIQSLQIMPDLVCLSVSLKSLDIRDLQTRPTFQTFLVRALFPAPTGA